MRVEVDLAAAAANWRRFDALGRAAAVVKADAYGLGAAPLARAFAEAGARTFFVATPYEGAAVRDALGWGSDIYVLGGYRQADGHLHRTAFLRPVINAPDEARAWIDDGRPGAACALHVDTGMNRLGAPMAAVAALAAIDLEPALVMSHLACASDPRDPMNAVQLARFRTVAAAFPRAQRSLAASAGALLGPDYAFDLVRPGIGLYGGEPHDGGASGLAPVARVFAPVLQVRDIAIGDSVGYGATFRAERPMRVATIGAGYADGILRSLSGRGYAVLAGERRPFLGRVSMDLISVDATGLAVAPGDAADLIGPGLTLETLAAAAGTANYELLTQLGAATKIYRGRA